MILWENLTQKIQRLISIGINILRNIRTTYLRVVFLVACTSYLGRVVARGEHYQTKRGLSDGCNIDEN